jgi:D-alanyl-D-alanine carboxypeptidase/poly-gamma-glutamate capsule biosynthesis protein CapA/YwtB (metallophosphatase superfamily)
MSKSKIKLIFWVIPPVILGIFFATLIFKNSNLGQILQPRNNLPAQINEASVIQLIAPEATKSQYFYVNKNINEQPKVSALSYLVGDLNTGEVILAKNQEEKFPIASLSKLMTALVAKEMMNSNDIAQVSKKALATKGTNGELKTGEKIKISDLLYPLLLESSNDAAEVLAQYFERDNFISKMNQTAEKLQMTSTSFADPSGLSEKNQSTVSDIFKLTGYLNQQKQDLFQITTKRSYSNKKHNWSNISQFLREDGYLGGKSGYTDEAKQTVVSLFSLPLGETDSRPIAITLLQSVDRHKDVETILKYLKKNIYYGGKADLNTNWIQEKIGTPDIKDPNFVTLAFVGDIMLARGVKNSVIKNFNNDYSALFEKLEILKKSDIVFANLEGAVSDQGTDQKNLYSFRMDPAVIPALKGAGISIVSVANNHVADWGRLAFIDTLPRLKENEILYTGGGNNKVEAEIPKIIEKYGMKIGFLGFSDKGPNYMAASEGKAGVLLASNPNFDEIIKQAAKQVDYLVVTFHFGEEYQAKHNARQEYLAHKAVDAGAKIIIGTHPHVIEDTEVYSPKGCTQSSCVSFIAYSLGNFIFDQSWSKPTMLGMLLELKLNRDGSMTVKKNTVQLNSAFQPDKIIKGQEEKVKFQETKTTSTL